MRTWSYILKLLLLSLLPLSLSAQETHTLGYCTDDLTDADMIGVDGEARISGAIHLPATTMQRYKDGRIIRIKVALREGIEKPSVWIRTSLGESSKVAQSISNPVYGWNEVTLNNPLTIDGSDLYIGFTFTQPNGVKGVLAKGQGNSDTSWLAFDNEWADYHSQGVGVLYIQAIAEADMSAHDLGIISLDTDSLCYHDGTLKATATIENLGVQAMDGFTLTWGIDGQTQHTDPNPSTAPSPGETCTSTCQLSLAGLSEGEHYAEVSINAEDDKTANNTLRIPFYTYTTTFPHPVLLEHFTSLPCVNCPPVDQLLESVVETRDDVVWVSHHVGYRNDEFTLPASEPYVKFGVLGNPYIMLDRYQLTGDTPAFTIGSFSTSDLNMAFDMVGQRPAFVHLDATLKAEGRQLTAQVSGTAKAFFKTLYPRATLNVYVVEDDVLAEGSQAGNANKKRHDNITRAILTRQGGNLLSWEDDEKFSSSFSTDADEGWDLDHLRLVAFVTAAADRSTGYPTGEVLNTVQVPLTDANCIREQTYSQGQAPRYYTIDGRLLPQRPQTPGLYIITDPGNGSRQKVFLHQ